MQGVPANKETVMAVCDPVIGDQSQLMQTNAAEVTLNAAEALLCFVYMLNYTNQQEDLAASWESNFHSLARFGGFIILVVIVIALLWTVRIMHHQRTKRFQLFQLRSALDTDLGSNPALEGDQRAELDAVIAAVNEEERRSREDWHWRFAINGWQDTTLQDMQALLQRLRGHVWQRFHPSERLALEQAKVDMAVDRRAREMQQDLRAAAARLRNQLQAKAKDHQQERWKVSTRELTEMRKVIVATKAELLNNPALSNDLDWVVDVFDQMVKRMGELRDAGLLDGSEMAELLDEWIVGVTEKHMHRRTGVRADGV
jgi:hypothetical protein